MLQSKTDRQISEYENIPFNPAIGLHCWGFVRHVYRDLTGKDLVQFPYRSVKDNLNAIEQVCLSLPECEPQNLAVFVLQSGNDKATGLLIESDGLYGVFMDCERSRVISWELIDRAFKHPQCFQVDSLISPGTPRA